MFCDTPYMRCQREAIFRRQLVDVLHVCNLQIALPVTSLLQCYVPQATFRPVGAVTKAPLVFSRRDPSCHQLELKISSPYIPQICVFWVVFFSPAQEERVMWTGDIPIKYSP